jgi:hypothetical protein
MSREAEEWWVRASAVVNVLQGSYAALDGGSTLWALEALTGDYVFKFKLEASSQVRGHAVRLLMHVEVA